VFFCRPGHPLLAKESLSTNDMFDYPLATTLIPPGIRKLLANLSGRIDFSPTIETEHFPALVKVVLQSNAIGVGTEEAFVEDIAKGSLVLLHWRNLPQNLESMNARCGIVSRTGFRLSPAARAMIETLVAVDRQEVSVAV
jgi:DNA-binding transcriptional LysR family regulator